MIEYGVLSYDGQNQKYTIEKAGMDLLSMIKEERTHGKTKVNDISIIFEYGFLG
jgi:hypothetical protein